jgi:hypothetical protein
MGVRSLGLLWILGWLYTAPISAHSFQGTGTRDSTAERIKEYGADAGFNFSISNTSPNWTGGANNNINVSGFIRAKYNLTRAKTSWDNNLNLNVGSIASRRIDNFGNRYWSNKKSLDNLFIDSKFGHSFRNIDLLTSYGGFNLQTQLLPGYTYSQDPLGRDVSRLTSSFMSVGQIQMAVGLELKPFTNYFLRLGYFTSKQSYVLNQNLYALRNTDQIARVSKGEYIDNQLGVQVQMGYEFSFGPNQQYKSKINYLGFAPYISPEPTLDSRIDFGLSAEISKHIQANYTLISIYDQDLFPKGESAWMNSWVLGIGYIHQW